MQWKWYALPFRIPSALEHDSYHHKEWDMAQKHRAVSGLQPWVDVEHGLVSRDIFVDETIYQQEQEQVFARAWLFIGHESQIPNPGDYFTSCMGEESVILTRDAQQQ